MTYPTLPQHQQANNAPQGAPLPQQANNALMQLLARTDWQRLFHIAVIVVNVGASTYGISKVMAAYAIGGILWAIVTGGMAIYFMIFFAAFAVVMIKRYDTKAMLATVMTLTSAFVI